MHAITHHKGPFRPPESVLALLGSSLHLFLIESHKLQPFNFYPFAPPEQHTPTDLET